MCWNGMQMIMKSKPGKAKYLILATENTLLSIIIIIIIIIITIISSETYYLSTNFVYVKFVGYNQKISHVLSICNR
jgi:hypothetical protein